MLRGPADPDQPVSAAQSAGRVRLDWRGLRLLHPDPVYADVRREYFLPPPVPQGRLQLADQSAAATARHRDQCLHLLQELLPDIRAERDQLHVADVDHGGLLLSRGARGGVHGDRHPAHRPPDPSARVRGRRARGDPGSSGVSGRFAGRSVIVTGGGRGIGQATARAFAAEGADVLVLGRTVADLEATVAQITDGGGQAWLLQCDVTDETQVEDATGRAVARNGRIDVLVNNAGIDDDTPFLEIDRSRWRNVIDTNLTGVFLMSQSVARQMAAAGGGVILHTASIDGAGADGPYAAYNASKAGLLGLNRTMALELASYGIRSNCVSPGFTHTFMTENADGPTLLAYLNGSFDRVPMTRLVRPDEVAAAFLFLTSDQASAITGIDLRVDCGLTANWYILETLPGD